jgi:hypothetical protein
MCESVDELGTDDGGCSDRWWQVAESTFPEDRGPSLNFLRSLAAAVTPQGPPNERKRIRVEFANGHRQRSANVEPFRDPAAKESDCDCSHNKLAFTDKEKIEGEVSAPCPTHGHFAPRGGGAVVDQRESVTKIPVQEHPDQVVNDREKRGRVKRAEPHGIRVKTMVRGDQCLPQAGNKGRTMPRDCRVRARVRAHGPEADCAPGDESTMFRVRYESQPRENNDDSTLITRRDAWGTATQGQVSREHAKLWGGVSSMDEMDNKAGS